MAEIGRPLPSSTAQAPEATTEAYGATELAEQIGISCIMADALEVAVGANRCNGYKSFYHSHIGSLAAFGKPTLQTVRQRLDTVIDLPMHEDNAERLAFVVSARIAAQLALYFLDSEAPQRDREPLDAIDAAKLPGHRQTLLAALAPCLPKTWSNTLGPMPAADEAALRLAKRTYDEMRPRHAAEASARAYAGQIVRHMCAGNMLDGYAIEKLRRHLDRYSPGSVEARFVDGDSESAARALERLLFLAEMPRASCVDPPGEAAKRAGHVTYYTDQPDVPAWLQVGDEKFIPHFAQDTRVAPGSKHVVSWYFNSGLDVAYKVDEIAHRPVTGYRISSGIKNDGTAPLLNMRDKSTKKYSFQVLYVRPSDRLPSAHVLALRPKLEWSSFNCYLLAALHRIYSLQTLQGLPELESDSESSSSSDDESHYRGG